MPRDRYWCGPWVGLVCLLATVSGGSSEPGGAGRAAPGGLVEPLPEPPPGNAAPRSAAVPAALRPVLIETLQAQSGAAYHVVTDGAEAGSPIYRAPNPAHGFTTRFDEQGVTLQPTDSPRTGGETPALALRLTGYGDAFAPAPVAMTPWHGTGGRVARSSLDPERPLEEWYVNGRLGLEQGFTVARPPGTGDTLVVDLAVGDGWTAAGRDAETVVLTAVGGGQLSYGQLTVIDAVGAVLPASLEVASSAIRVQVSTTGAHYPIVIDPVIQTQKLLAAGGRANESVGYSVAVSGGTAVVGAIYDDDYGADSGAAYVFVQSGTSWSQQAKLTASDAAAGYKLGFSVAVDGDTAVAGSYHVNALSGAAYVFVRSGTSWSQQAKLTASDAAAGDRFGYSVAVSGNTVAIGAVFDDGSSTDSGSAYVFVRSGTSWSQQRKLTASASDVERANQYFGVSVALQGDTVVVGAQGDVAPVASSGSAYVFVRNGVIWSAQAKLTASDGSQSRALGGSVAISGNTAVIGAYTDDITGGQVDQGSAYVFVRSGTSWSQQAKLVASDGGALDYFGFRVSVSGDTAVIGAYAHDTVGANQGAAYAFVRTGTTWSLQQTLVASDGAAGDQFGWSVAVDGDTAVVGASLDDYDATDAGSFYVFARSATSWSSQAKPPVSDFGGNDSFGAAVALSGNTAVVGAPQNDDGGTDSGAAYVFVRTGSSWVWQAKLLANDAAAGDLFGWSVAVDGDTAVVGAPYATDGGAYVFVRSGTNWSQQQELTASNPNSFDQVGYSVAVAGDTVVVGVLLRGGTSGSGAVYWFTRSGTVWNRVEGWEFVGGRFGSSVAISGDTVVVGAPAEPLAGAYVFVRDGLRWDFHLKLSPPSGTAPGSLFGSSVAISGDTVVVGAPNDPITIPPAGGGSAYVFRRNGGTWSQQARLRASDAPSAAFGGFGYSVAISGDRVVVGWFSRGAYVFDRSGTSWSELQKLSPSDDASGNDFGTSVAVAGNLVMVGDSQENVTPRYGAAYAFYVVKVTQPFTDDSIGSGTHVIKAVHFQQMRDRINALLTERNLGQFEFTPALVSGTTINYAHVQQLRENIRAVFLHDGAVPPSWSNIVGAGSLIRAIDITQLRAAIVDREGGTPFVTP